VVALQITYLNGLPPGFPGCLTTVPINVANKKGTP